MTVLFSDVSKKNQKKLVHIKKLLIFANLFLGAIITSSGYVSKT